jgi:hypothetical protein
VGAGWWLAPATRSWMAVLLVMDTLYIIDPTLYGDIH